MNTKFLFILAGYLTISSACVFASSGDKIPFALPSIPQGCTRITYKTSPTFPPKGASEFEDGIWNAKEYLMKIGVKFPKRGYAYFYKKNSILTLCTDEKNQDFFLNAVNN